MKPISFKEVERDLIEAAQKQLDKEHITDPDGFEMVNGFFVQQILDEYGPNYTIGGPGRGLFTVALIAKSTGRVYYFSAKKLLPEVFK